MRDCRKRHFSPIRNQSTPRIRVLPTFLVKIRDLQLLKVAYQCEIGTEGYNDTEKVEESTCENSWMKSSIILLLKNALSISYINLTACVSIFSQNIQRSKSYVCLKAKAISLASFHWTVSFTVLYITSQIFVSVRYLSIILRGRAGYRMIDNQRGA